MVFERIKSLLRKYKKPILVLSLFALFGMFGKALAEENSMFLGNSMSGEKYDIAINIITPKQGQTVLTSTFKLQFNVTFRKNGKALWKQNYYSNKAFEQFFLNNLPIKETLNAIKQST